MTYGAPVKDGEEIEVLVEAVGKKGDGIAKIQGYTIFIEGAKMDEKVKVKITKAKEKFAFAEIIPDNNTQENTSEDIIEDTEDFGE